MLLAALVTLPELERQGWSCRADLEGLSTRRSQRSSAWLMATCVLLHRGRMRLADSSRG